MYQFRTITEQGDRSLVGFARTTLKAEDLTGQINALKNFGCGTLFSGQHSDTPEVNAKVLAELAEEVRAGDTVVITKLDQLGRSLNQVLTAIAALEEKGVGLITLDQQIDTSNKADPMAKAMLHLLGVFAQLDRDLMIQRTTEGKERTGRKGGRPLSLTAKQESAVISHYLKTKNISGTAREFNINRETVRTVIRRNKESEKTDSAQQQ